MNKILVKIFFPKIDKWYEVWIPKNLTVSSIINQLSKGINELNDNVLQNKELSILYNRATGKYYDFNTLIQNTNIINGTELIFM